MIEVEKLIARAIQKIKEIEERIRGLEKGIIDPSFQECP